MPMIRALALLLAVFMVGAASSLPAQQPAGAIADPAEAAPASERPSDLNLGNVLSVVEPMADRTVVFTGRAAWDAATTSTLVMADDRNPARLVLADERPKAFPRRGTWISPTIETEFPVTEVLPSWNVETPPNTGFTFEVSTRSTATGKWSDYVYMGQWGRTVHWPDRTLETETGGVHVDILKLTEPASALRVRVRFFSFDLASWAKPALRRLTVVYSGPTKAPLEVVPPPRPAEGWKLPVPFTPQGDNPEAIAGSTCSPTSTRMVMAYRGVELPLTEVALGIYDPEYGIFGTWNRAVAFAGSHGLDASLTRIRSWEQVETLLAQGQPIIASIRFRRGEFPENVLKSTNGHLIVVRGMTPEGDLIVNDPASREKGEAVVYTRASLKNAWLDKGGVGYLIGPPAGN